MRVMTTFRAGCLDLTQGATCDTSEQDLTQATAADTNASGGVYRSGVPDLLFPDVRRGRISDITPLLDAPERLDASASLHRVTLFLTYRCQLSCGYCKTIARGDADLRRFPQKRDTFDLVAFRALIDGTDATIDHLHFTGGEATLVRDLPSMVAYARDRGIAHVSITTNGVAPWSVYEALVESGISEIRVSIDASDAMMGERLSGRPRAWSHAVSNFAALAQLRRRSGSFFLIANTVIGMVNRTQTAEIVRFLMELGADDIKLIADVDETPTLGQFPQAAGVIAEIEALLAAQPPSAFPLLRRKLFTVFSESAVGLREVVTNRGDDWRCYIPLTERTVDRRFYYPCSVYLREGGAPLGQIDEPQDVQRAKIARFVRDGRCLSDSICRRYCLRCTSAFNAAANDARPIPPRETADTAHGQPFGQAGVGSAAQAAT